ncbi:hypothetical protein IFM89_031257 [Coptis chinensis]|uniref:30S ribosomal protein S15, chloroplastic n=1 Tax=Coptis chinensis TaxID=261450 RepID=A0A835IS93_9MAGN|nr:hypothetical protein IFM89_031257 [Coptis chinensis]
MGGSETVPLSLLKTDAGPAQPLQSGFVRMYSYAEFGEKLQQLRPDEIKGKNWFSLEELNERLKKLRKKKLKLELKKVRDEFKTKESDCGSSRVQANGKKVWHYMMQDKHSLKGLHEMVQRRKKLLRYLRRTDWESYFFCLEKLGLRDNPDYKN